MGRKSLLGLIYSLESTIEKMHWRPRKSEWTNYYSESSHVPKFLEEKIKLVTNYLDTLKPDTVWDFGANTGVFSRIASDRGISTVSMDSDYSCVEKNYLQSCKKGEKNLLPLWVDLNNPSPGIGWENKERMSLQERGPVDTILALALIHHLTISNNVPLAKIASFFSNNCQSLIIEFVPKSDSMVQKLLASRKDIFPDYTKSTFEKEFQDFLKIIRSEQVGDSKRTLYLMKNKSHA
jgi:ribosomal protein L11 methylase PrmA